MKTKFLKSLLIACLFSGVTQAQEAEPAGVPMPARVIGGISDGTPAPPAPPKVLPEYEVRKRQVVRKGGQKITINRVVPPVAASPEEPQPEDPIQPQSTLPHGGTFMVYATTYDDSLTYVRWNHDGRLHGAWSNANFKLLEGFVSFEGRGKQFTFMMLNGASSMEQLRAASADGNRYDLPEIVDFTELKAKNYPAYMLMEGDNKDKAAMDFIEAIHDLYEAEYQRLVAAQAERQKNRAIRAIEEEQLRLNPPPKPDVTVNYWKKAPEPKEEVKPAAANQ